jgi:hypothetical protein
LQLFERQYISTPRFLKLALYYRLLPFQCGSQTSERSSSLLQGVESDAANKLMAHLIEQQGNLSELNK